MKKKPIKTNDGWEQVEFMVDSGAAETVVSEDALPDIELKEGIN